MTIFRFADGRVEEHDDNPRLPVYHLVGEGNFPAAFEPVTPEFVSSIPVLDFVRVMDGERWQIAPERFDPCAALVRQDAKLEHLRDALESIVAHCDDPYYVANNGRALSDGEREVREMAHLALLKATP